MVLTIKKDASRDEIILMRKKLERQQKKTGVNTKKFCGTIKLKEDPMEIQKKLRDEWI